jgi:hypothetical protein
MNTIVNGFFVLVSRAFGRYNAAHLVTFFQNVIELVTANVPFAGIKPPTAEGQAALDDLKAKGMAAVNGGKIEKAALMESRQDFLVIGRQWANYVEANCGGVLSTLLSSGFEARKAPTPPTTPETPTSVRVNYTNTTGRLRVLFKGKRNNRNYAVQYAESADGPWIDLPLASATRVDVNGLTPGKTYWFRVQAIGVKGMSSIWSATTSKMAI